MVQTLIPGGYILLSRKILNNEIMKKPPLYFKVWLWLLLNAQHKEYGTLKRGQLFTSIPEIQEAMSYKVGFRTEKPSKKQIWGVLEWLRNPIDDSKPRFPHEGNTKVTTAEPMIVTTKVTHGIIITVVNYDLYQTPSNYEGNNEGNNEGTTKEQRRERQGNNINKNDKNDKNDKKYIDIDIVESDHIPYKEIVDYLNQRCGTSYRHTTRKTRDLIRARWKEGFKLDDFYMVIDKKAAEWLNDPKMSKYLRPETLFGPKFEGYLNQPVRRTLADINLTPNMDLFD